MPRSNVNVRATAGNIVADRKRAKARYYALMLMARLKIYRKSVQVNVIKVTVIWPTIFSITIIIAKKHYECD